MDFICKACNKQLNRNTAVFTEEREPYCSNIFTCNEEHINSTKNILKRQSAVPVYKYNELDYVSISKMDITEEIKTELLKIGTKPYSIRISDYKMALFLLQLQEKHGYASVSDSIRYCIEQQMLDKNFDKPKQAEELPKQKPITVSKGIKIDLTKTHEPAPEPKKEEPTSVMTF